ncbi:TetR/AcrR family transcriptional regulator [Leptobacterium sp. I13]|uniref:TetR/AcrR family transcriptional regulator n=1 Tax=Leptobacterium meishanense TaxID=3128904 RepID=UPI0030ECE899
MASKATKTTHYIIKTVAPIFTKKGYAGTSLSDLTEATDLTKGAIYGNFKNKEDLALQCFKYSVDVLIGKIHTQINTTDSAIQKLFVLTNFYRFYNSHVKELGGCPILSVGMDAYGRYEGLLSEVQTAIEKILAIIADSIVEGKSKNEINPFINPYDTSKKLYSLICGSVFMATVMNNPAYLKEGMNHVDQVIIKELKR